MKRQLLCLILFTSAAAAVIYSLSRGVWSGNAESESEGLDRAAFEQRYDARSADEFISESTLRLECSNLKESANIARDMARYLSEQPSMSMGKDTVIGLINAVEKLESRRIVLANGVSAAAREFDRLEGDDFTFAVNSICALRLFCAKASARSKGVGDVASELWLVHFLTRAKTRLDNADNADRVRLLDQWLQEAWSFIDSRESSAYKATKKLWEDGLRRILVSRVGDDYCEQFVDHVRKSFIDRIAKTGDGHIVPWECEFTYPALAAKIVASQDKK